MSGYDGHDEKNELLTNIHFKYHNAIVMSVEAVNLIFFHCIPLSQSFYEES